ncbi:MAG: GDSL-type esterase/lipase family protein [Actinomycetota bacterium]
MRGGIVRCLAWVSAIVVLVACASTDRGVLVEPFGTSSDGAPQVSLVRGPFTSVAMVGDSITKASRTSLTDVFMTLGMKDQYIDGEVGRRIEVGNGNGPAPLSGIRTLYGMLAMKAKPDVWVVELGTNDVGSYAKPDDYGHLIDQVLGMLPKDAPLVWVNTYREQYLDATKVFNLVLLQRIESRGHAVVADWFSVASVSNQNVLRTDHLHPNTNGQKALALLVAQALQRL